MEYQKYTGQELRPGLYVLVRPRETKPLYRFQLAFLQPGADYFENGLPEDVEWFARMPMWQPEA